MNDKKKIAFLCHPYHRGGVTRWMADAAIAWSAKGFEVYFVTLEPEKEFFSGKGRETMLQLLKKTKHNIHIGSVKVGREFEFGLPAYNAHVYQKLLLEHVPPGVPLILSDDKIVWQAASQLHTVYPLVGVLHADEEPYYILAQKYNKYIDIFVCVSARVNMLVKKRCPEIKDTRIFTIPCGIQLPPQDFNYQQNNLLKLVYVGRIADHQKRTSDLAKIALELKKANILFHLNIIGDGLEPKKTLVQTIKDTVGIRIPSNKICLEIVKELGHPLMSASLPMDSEVEYFTDPELMEEEFGNLVDIVIDGGIGGIISSTIIDCTDGTPTVTRVGAGEWNEND